MCGFFGQFSSNPKVLENINDKLISKKLAHRGPDDYGQLTGNNYRVIFWRLSIVDHVSGKQPMVSDDGKKIILFNGEIYNFKSLRNILEKEGMYFKTRSDTEVILTAYQKWGVSCFNHFEGMFAICIIDCSKNRVFLARDRLGVKPLYYAISNQGLIVASEQKAIVAAMDESPRLDRESFNCYLVFQTVVGEKTLFDGIFKLSAGKIVEFCLKTQKRMSIHSIRSNINFPLFDSYDCYRNITKKNIEEQTALSFDTDLPICFHLSGGLDSNTLIALSRYFNPKRKFTCVSSIVNGHMDAELEYIKKSVDYHKCRFLTVDVNRDSFFEILDDVFYYLDEPVGDPGVVAQFLVNRLAAQDSKIVFSGQGFDELFFGYTRNLATYAVKNWGIMSLLMGSPEYKTLPMNIRKFFKGWEGFLKSMALSMNDPLDFTYFKKLCRFNPFLSNNNFKIGYLRQLQQLALNVYQDLQNNCDNLHDFMLAAETKIQLPSLLHMEDRASMRYSLETRVPFCTSSIMELAKLGRLDWKFYNHSPKGILRDIFKDIIPGHILKRKQKVGRPIPLRNWLNCKKGQEYVKTIKKKRELFKDLTGTDFVKYSLNHPNPYDRSAWAALSVSKWIDIYNVQI